MDDKQLKKNIKNIKSAFEYILSTLDDEKSIEYASIIFEKFKRVVDIKKLKTICLYDNFNNEVLVHNIIKYARDNNIKISVMNDKIKTPKLIESVEVYKREKDSMFKSLPSTSIKSAKLLVFSALLFDERAYFISHKNLYKVLTKNNKALRLAISHDFQIIPKIELPESSEIVDIILSEARLISIDRLFY